MGDASPLGGDAGRAVVVGSGPNGLAAAIVLAIAGWSVVVRESAETPGGGVRSGELTLPGFSHDLGSAVHPLGISSPLFSALPLSTHGLTWIHPDVPLAHPLDGEPPVLLHRSIAETAAGLDARDAVAYARLMGPLADHWNDLSVDLLAPTFPARFPNHPLLMARFGRRAITPAATLARTTFRGERGRALFAGLAAHSILPLTWAMSSAFGLVLGAAGHAAGWPLPMGGSGRLSRALIGCLQSLGGRIETASPVRSLDELTDAEVVMLDVTPRQLLGLAGARLSARDRDAYARFRYGPGVYKMDWALREPIPWRDRECARAGTVHLGGTLQELTASEAAPWHGSVTQRPFVLLVQPTLFDPSRAPPGRHIAWAYAHVPNGSTVDIAGIVEAQIERFAPGFGEVVLARSTMPPARLEAYNPNLIGGDLGGGANTVRQILFRPVPRRDPYATGIPNVYLCSSSTPPGGGVHGMCGYHAAHAALEDRRQGGAFAPRRRAPPL